MTKLKFQHRQEWFCSRLTASSWFLQHSELRVTILSGDMEGMAMKSGPEGRRDARSRCTGYCSLHSPVCES